MLERVLHIEERCVKIPAYFDKNCRRTNILKMRTDRQTDTSSDNNGRYRAREPLAIS